MVPRNDSVQFRSIDEAFTAFKMWGMSAFAIWQRTQLVFTYVGETMQDAEQAFMQFAELLASNGSAAVYTCSVYQEVSNKGLINNKTPYHGSFNFLLNDRAEINGVPVRGDYNPYGNSYAAQINELKEEIKKLREERQAEPESKLGALGEILDHPAVEPAIAPLIGRLMDWLIPEDKAPGALTQTTRIHGVKMGQDEAIDKELERLSNYVEDLPAMLRQMADLAEQRPKKFKFYVNALMAMKF